MIKAVVIDLDGTLCDVVHRESYAKAGEWEEFHKRCADDTPREDVVWLLNALLYSSLHTDRHHTEVIALTGRDEGHYTETMKWLARNNLSMAIDHVIMRPIGNFEPDHELKPRLLAEHFGSMEIALSSVAFILEDRDKVVEAWRNLGFNCWQVQAGNY